MYDDVISTFSSNRYKIHLCCFAAQVVLAWWYNDALCPRGTGFKPLPANVFFFLSCFDGSVTET